MTAVGRVISYDQITGVLKYWQDRTPHGFDVSGRCYKSTIWI